MIWDDGFLFGGSLMPLESLPIWLLGQATPLPGYGVNQIDRVDAGDGDGDGGDQL